MSKLVDDIKAELGDDWLPRIYESRVRSGRTRAYAMDIPPHENVATIHYTLLGIELKVGRRRYACPDLPTARYLRVFARIGAREFAIPYDITRVSSVADELEVSWQRTLILFEQMTRLKTLRSVSQLRSRLVKAVREHVAEIGPGKAIPDFDRQTRQRIDVKFGRKPD